jgi:alkylhydroperoxidase/carboxymuconolactone decarboxylase family protein YurZ
LHKAELVRMSALALAARIGAIAAPTLVVAALRLRAGLREGGFSADDLKEVPMHTAIYARVPDANTGFAEVRKIIAMLEQDA